MKISEDNSVFVNFIGDEDIQKHGVSELFKKINFFFKRTESYRNAFNRDIEREAEELRERAKDELFSYKIGGSLIGAIPIIDFVVQKYAKKRSAINKISQIFGLDIDEIEKYEREILEKEDIINELGTAGKSLLTTAGDVGGGAVIEM